MAKWLKITIVLVAFLIAATSITFFCLQAFGFKGQRPEDIDRDQEGEEQIIDDDTKPIASCSPNESLFILSGKMDKLSYHAIVSGEVVALGGLYKQNVSGEKFYQNGRALYVSKSTSAFVNVGKKIYIEPTNEVNVFDATDVKNDIWSNQATHFNTLKDYLQEFGVDFRNISNYLLNDETILESELVEVSNNNYKYKYKLDTEKATIGYRINMAKMGNLSTVPAFSSCTLTVVMNQNFEPISATFDDVYMVEYSILGGLECTSKLTISFDQLNQEIVFP